MDVLDQAATRAALPFDRLIPALQRLFVSGCTVPQRGVHNIPAADGSMTTYLVMPAWEPDGCFGIKIIGIAPQNAQRGLPGLHASYTLFDTRTGVPIAVIDGSELTSRRTAAASALAAQRIFMQKGRLDQPRRLLVVGSGRIAELLPEAYRSAVPISSVHIWARRPEAAQAVANRLSGRGIEVHVAQELPAAVNAADIISTATLATEPVVRGEWLKPGCHLDLIGSFSPSMREADDACFADADLYVDTPEALQKSGELLGPMERGVFSAADVRGTLTALCRDQSAHGSAPIRRTVFKSVGTALEDLAAAKLAVGRA